MNSIIYAAIVSWLIAQLVKVVCNLFKYGVKEKSRIIWRIIWAGGMPSAHSAVITSATLGILSHSGMDSPLFGFSAVVCLIVIYDRSRMYSIYSMFQKKYPVFAQEIQEDPILKDMVGHRIPEIIAGIIIGAGVSIIFSIL